MRVAALYDIHGNLPALDAVLKEVYAVGVDAEVVGGDVLPGPMPRVVATFLAGGDITEVPEAFRDSIAWTADQLDAPQRNLLASWPQTHEKVIPGVGRTLFVQRAGVEVHPQRSAYIGGRRQLLPVNMGTAPTTRVPFARGDCHQVSTSSQRAPKRRPRSAAGSESPATRGRTTQARRARPKPNA